MFIVSDVSCWEESWGLQILSVSNAIQKILSLDAFMRFKPFSSKDLCSKDI